MTIKRGEIWIVNLNPTRGSEQAGTRPVIVFQNDAINQFTTTLLTIPLTTNLRRAALPHVSKSVKAKVDLKATPSHYAINSAYWTKHDCNGNLDQSPNKSLMKSKVVSCSQWG